MNIEMIKQLLPKIPAIVKAILSDKNKDRFGKLLETGGEMKEDFEQFAADLYDDAGVCAQLVLEILHDPLQEAGIDYEIKSRNVKKAELEAAIKVELARNIEKLQA